MITENIAKLVEYGLACGLVEKEDRIYTVNKCLELFEVEDFDVEMKETDIDVIKPETFPLEELLKEMLDYAAKNGLIKEDSIVYRDLFDTKIMGCLLPRPSEVIRKFRTILQEQGAKAATDWYYQFSQDTDYIRRYRIKKDRKLRLNI